MSWPQVKYDQCIRCRVYYNVSKMCENENKWDKVLIYNISQDEAYLLT